MAQYKLNPKANSFFDPKTNVKLSPGETVEISETLISNSKRLKRAISGRHLITVDQDNTSSKNLLPIATLEDKMTLLNQLHKNGQTYEKIAKKFNTKTLEEMCKECEIEIEEGDTKTDLVEAILGEMNPPNNSDTE